MYSAQHPTIQHYNRTNFELNIIDEPDENTLVLELIHCDVSLANALRRILLAEVPTVALEHVYLWNNSSLVHDEVLAHRLGLIPLAIDARLLEDALEPQQYGEASVEEEEFTPTDRNTVVFRLAATCGKGPTEEGRHREDDDEDEHEDDVVQPDPELVAAAKDAAPRKLKYPADRPYTKHVYSRDFVWIPQGDQEQLFTEPLRPVHDDILIAKLRPGQVIELEAHGRRGIGKDHAKYSPVATASYRLMPRIELLQPIYDDLAEELVHIHEPGVFELVETDEDDPPNTRVKARLCNPYACTMSRNYMRNPILDQSIRMSRIADHFIFSIESVGAYRPGVLLSEALNVLQQKCQDVMDLMDEQQQQELHPATPHATTAGEE